MRRGSRFVWTLALVAFAWACGETSGTAPTLAEDGPHPIAPVADDGKADNYVSTNAREFRLTGKATFALDEAYWQLDEAARPTELERRLDRRLAVVSRAVRTHVDRVVSAANNGVTGEDAHYFIFVKRDAAEALPPDVVDEKTAVFAFDIELVGSYFLMSKVAPEETSGSRRTFEVEVKDWNDVEGEKVEVEIRGSESRDAFPKYNELFEDGVFDIAIHFGGDYNEGRFDMGTAKWTVEELLGGSWSHETVTAFEELKIDSAPFTRELLVAGKTIEVRVYVYHSDMVEPADEQLLADVMKKSLAERDVVFYSGHAGPGSGFVLDYQPRLEMKASTFESLQMAEKYQIFVLDGCQTYRTYVDDLMKNPNKTFDNLDIITAVNTTPFTVGYHMIWEFLYWFTVTDDAGGHFPLSWKALLRGVNTREFASVHYGVHGVDGDPRLNPHGGAESLCAPCSSDSDCGGNGNFCLGFAAGAGCGVACTNDTACGQGFRCGRITNDPKLFHIAKQCMPRDYVCGG